MDKIKEIVSPILFPNSKVRLNFKDFNVVIDSSVHGVCQVEHDSENIYLTIKRVDAIDVNFKF